MTNITSQIMYNCIMCLSRQSPNSSLDFSPCYSGGKKNPDLTIKSTENINMTCRHCKRLVTTPTDVVLYLYSQLYEIALRILYIRCCELKNLKYHPLLIHLHRG